MQRNLSKWLGFSALLLIAACAETKNLPKKGALSASVLQGGSCTAAPPAEAGSSGMIRLDAIKNYAKGRLEFRGKAFVTGKEIAEGKSLSSLLGFVTRSERARKVLKKMEGKNISPSIEVSLGSTVPSESEGATPMVKMKAAELQNFRQNLGVGETASDSSPVLVLQQVPEIPGLYLSDAVNPPSIPLSDMANMQGNNANFLGGVGRYRSMMIEARGTGASAVLLPSDPEPSGDGKGYSDSPLKNAKAGEPISVEIAPDDTKRPADTDSKIVVKVFEKSSNPTALQTCLAEDPAGGGVIAVPTDKIKPGEYYATVTRVYRMSIPMPDDEKKSKIVIETAVSAGTTATVAKPEGTK